MTFQNLSFQEAAFRGASHEARVTFADLNTTAATSLTQTLAASLPAGTRIEYVGHQLDTAFAGGATTDLTAALGWDYGAGTDDADGLLAATSLHAAATFVKYGPAAVADVDASAVDGVYGAEEQAVIGSNRTKLNTLIKRGPKVANDTASLNVVWTATGANLTALTAGEVRFWFRITTAAVAA